MSEPKEIHITPSNDILLSCQHDNNQLSAEVSKLNDVVEELKAKLLIAAQYIEDWGVYADDYFQKKHDLPADIKEIRDAAK